jgi:hypothetical protein
MAFKMEFNTTCKPIGKRGENVITLNDPEETLWDWTFVETVG